MARDENFLGFADQVCRRVSPTRSDTATLLASGIEDARQALVQKIGENINLRRIERLSVEGDTCRVIESYIHNNKIGVLIALRGGDAALARDMDAYRSCQPMVIRAEDVPEDVLAKESEIYLLRHRKAENLKKSSRR